MPPLAGLAEERGGPLLILGNAVAEGEQIGEVGTPEGVAAVAAPLEQ
jgi:hypothetical protein